MEQKDANISLSHIINSLFTSQPIDPSLFTSIQVTQQGDMPAYLGLINVLYDFVRKYFGEKKVNEGDGMEAEGEKREGKFTGGEVLKIRGEILTVFAIFLAGLLPKPSYYVARFDYEAFNEYCIKRGLLFLLRHSRGIYPEIDPKKTPLLQFLSFYQQAIDSPPALFGNVNYKNARKMVGKFYDEQIVTGLVYHDRTQIYGQGELNFQLDFSGNDINVELEEEENSSENERHERNGIRLAYILILAKFQELGKYVQDLKRYIFDKEGDKKENEIIVDRLQFWFKNYRNFLREGLNMYQRGQDKANITLVQDSFGNSFEQIIIQIIQDSILLWQSKQKMPIKERIKNKLNSSVDLLVKEEDFEGMSRTNKNLLLAFISSIHKTIFGDTLQSRFLAAYEKINMIQNPEQDAFNRIFYNDTQLLALYQSGKIKQYPIFFNYGHDLSIKLLKTVCEVSPEKLSENLSRLSILSTAERFEILTRSRLLGKVEQFEGQFGHYAGQKIINYLQKNQKQFKEDLVSNEGKPLNEQFFNSEYKKFIDSWRQFYAIFRDFTISGMQKLLQEYGKRKNQRQWSKSDKLRLKDLPYPMQKPDAMYNLTSLFLKQLQKVKKSYLKELQLYNHRQKSQQNQQNMKKHQDQLYKFMKILQKQQFKQMLQQADQNYIFDIHDGTSTQDHNQQFEADKQRYQDQIWKQYATCYLLLGDYCEKLIDIVVLSGGKNIAGNLEEEDSEHIYNQGSNSQYEQDDYDMEIQDDDE